MGCGSSSQSEAEPQKPRLLVERAESVDRHGNGSVPSARKNGGIVNNNVPKTALTHLRAVEDEELHISNPDDVQLILDNLQDGELFCDPDFTPGYSALFCTAGHSDGGIMWLRPQELLEEGQIPELMVDGVTRDDIKQGILGDCWFLSSCAAVSQNEACMRKVLPSNQKLCGENYKGVVCFNFWRFGEWRPVHIDDRLPCIDKKLIYGHSSDPREYWVALIEKAYAKLHGSYEAVEGGITMDALVDLTGGLAERYDVKEYDPTIYHLILHAHRSGAFIACAKKGDWRTSMNAEGNGLVPGHAYTVTGVTKIQHEMGEEKLLRLRNPWGDSTEWRGSWSDNDVNWQWVDEATKQKIQVDSRDDGEFWIAFRDFCHHFQEVTICLLGPDFDGDGVSDAVGHMETIIGEWVIGESAGGSRNNLEMFATNPQFLLTLREADKFNFETDDAEFEGKCIIVISLMQEIKQTLRRSRPKSLQIGFSIYKTNTPERKLPSRHFRYNPDCGKNGVYINFREVSGRFELEPGTYIIIPSTFHPNYAATFMLRVFGEKPFSLSG
ncbi:hypothetical protein C0Q70_06899 [Pomacea canaliculata]|uniref:Calpain catalytic domain-containing protein n=2 Tax=Pomacea canaliculata TaxID=400727 RepID=A0A2T7PDI9_POMCA|nr:hypothetical protein C0Q70_06899 [Pomacea canaliculata]